MVLATGPMRIRRTRMLAHWSVKHKGGFNRPPGATRPLASCVGVPLIICVEEDNLFNNTYCIWPARGSCVLEILLEKLINKLAERN